MREEKNDVWKLLCRPIMKRKTNFQLQELGPDLK